jgi:hypothetical protein
MFLLDHVFAGKGSWKCERKNDESYRKEGISHRANEKKSLVCILDDDGSTVISSKNIRI